VLFLRQYKCLAIFDLGLLIDGVAINGVSGGPVILRRADDTVRIIGAITAYMPNRLTSGTLPGLSVAQDVSHFQKIVTQFKSSDEAARKKKEQEAALQALKESGLPVAPPKKATAVPSSTSIPRHR
jgi:hypothetical protein